jgi:hypothetical protein
LLMQLQIPWRNLNGCSLGDACLRVPDYAESRPQSLHHACGAGGSKNSPVQDPMTCMELWCHTTSSSQIHLTGVWPRDLLCFRSGALRRWDPLDVETWIEMLREKLKHISSLLQLGASVDAFLETCTSSVHPLVG